MVAVQPQIYSEISKPFFSSSLITTTHVGRGSSSKPRSFQPSPAQPQQPQAAEVIKIFMNIY